MIDQGVHVDLREQRVHVDPVEQGADVDALRDLVEVLGLHDTRGDPLGRLESCRAGVGGQTFADLVARLSEWHRESLRNNCGQPCRRAGADR